jgi:hypothetical protein
MATQRVTEGYGYSYRLSLYCNIERVNNSILNQYIILPEIWTSS